MGKAIIFANILLNDSLNLNLKLLNKDAILIGPHLKYLEENIKEIIEPEGVPFAFISDMNYAKMDGAAILEQAKSIMK